MPRANRARRRCEIRHYAPVVRGRTSPSGCQGATLVTAGVIPAPVGPDPAQPCPPSRVHLQVRGGIAGSRVEFQAPAANKTLCHGTFALSALGERYGVPVVLPGGHRGLGEPGPVAPTLPHAVPLHLGKQTSPCHCSPVHLCPARFGHCIPSHCSFSRAGIPACARSMLHRAPPLARGQRGAKMSPALATTAFSSPLPTHHTALSIRICLAAKVHPPFAISRQQNHALWLNTGFSKSLTIFIPIFLGVFFHAALSSSALENKVPRAPACGSPLVMSNLICLLSLSARRPSPSTLKIGLSLTLSIITCSNMLSPIRCQARKSSSIT